MDRRFQMNIIDKSIYHRLSVVGFPITITFTYTQSQYSHNSKESLVLKTSDAKMKVSEPLILCEQQVHIKAIVFVKSCMPISEALLEISLVQGKLQSIDNHHMRVLSVSLDTHISIFLNMHVKSVVF